MGISHQYYRAQFKESCSRILLFSVRYKESLVNQEQDTIARLSSISYLHLLQGYYWCLSNKSIKDAIKFL